MQRKNWRDITEAEREQIVDEAYDLIDRLRTENITPTPPDRAEEEGK